MDYTFLEDVTYDRLALFQVAADRYSDNGFQRYAYGNEDGASVIGEITNHTSSGYASEANRGIEMSGESPWVMLYQNGRDSDSLPEHLANIGFVVRDYQANIGGVESNTPILNLIQTYNGGYSQVGFELGVPYDATSPVIPAGSTVRATVEYLVPPADKSVYYGESDYLLEMGEDSYQSTEMMLKLASENTLSVVANSGSVVRNQPVELQAVNDTTAVDFTLTGGLGYVPVTIHGSRPDGWRLEREIDGSWSRVDQSVEGNDYWQAYDDVNRETQSGLHVHNRGTQRARPTLQLEP